MHGVAHIFRSLLGTFLNVEHFEFISPSLHLGAGIPLIKHRPRRSLLRGYPIPTKQDQVVVPIGHHATPTHLHGGIGGVVGFQFSPCHGGGVQLVEGVVCHLSIPATIGIEIVAWRQHGGKRRHPNNTAHTLNKYGHQHGNRGFPQS